MVPDLSELTYDLEQDGETIRRQLDRVILERRGWATVLFLFEERDRRKGAMQPPRVAVVRLRKTQGMWRRHAAYTLSDRGEVETLLDALGRWRSRLAASPAEDAAGDGDDA